MNSSIDKSRFNSHDDSLCLTVQLHNRNESTYTSIIRRFVWHFCTYVVYKLSNSIHTVFLFHCIRFTCYLYTPYVRSIQLHEKRLCVCVTFLRDVCALKEKIPEKKSKRASKYDTDSNSESDSDSDSNTSDSESESKYSDSEPDDVNNHH